MAPHHRSLWLCDKVLLETLKKAHRNVANAPTAMAMPIKPTIGFGTVGAPLNGSLSV